MLINLSTNNSEDKSMNDQNKYKILQHQLKELLLSIKLKNRILIGTLQDYQWQEIKIIVPLSIPVINFNHLTQVKFLIRFCSNWPHTLPGLYMESPHIHTQLWYVNIMESAKWQQDQPKTLQFIIQKVIQELDSIGLEEWLRNTHGITKKYGVKCTHMVNQINNNNNKLDKSNINHYSNYTTTHIFSALNGLQNQCNYIISDDKQLSNPKVNSTTHNNNNNNNYNILQLTNKNRQTVLINNENGERMIQQQKQQQKLSSSLDHFQNKQCKQLQTNCQDINILLSKNIIKKQSVGNVGDNNCNIFKKDQQKQIVNNIVGKDCKIICNKISNPGFVPYRPSLLQTNTTKYLQEYNKVDNIEKNQINQKQSKYNLFNFCNTKIEQQPISNQCQQIFDLEFDNYNNNKKPKPMNKNANLPKFLIRIFIKYLQKYKSMYIKKQYDNLISQCRKMKQWKKNDRRQHAFGLKHLKNFFQDKIEGFPQPHINRKVIFKIINNYLLQEICQNSQIPQSHRTGYLIACRVYSIRCRNSNLAGRIQSK